MRPTPLPYRDPFTVPGHWYRGNLHTHSTASDGLRTPQEAADWYREQGYDFIALTDHDVLVDVGDLSAPGFLVLPGQEAHPDRNLLGEVYHLVAVGSRRGLAFDQNTPVQEAINALRDAGGLVFLAHPYWAGMTLPDMLPLEGLAGVEVYNTVCDLFAKGVSAPHWDDLLARGRLLWGLAVDDAHWFGRDSGRGWVWVKAPALTQEHILDALASGCFYASQGPRIEAFEVSGEEVHVRCSPARSIRFVSYLGHGRHWRADDDDHLLTEAAFPLAKLRGYVRAECTDAQGHSAWSPPVFL
ncbi:MAG: PHP domain-containing protein [Anaerolineae bacterium]